MGECLITYYKDNNASLYAYTLLKTVEFCQKAYEENKIDTISTLLGLSDEDIKVVIHFLKAKDYKSFIFSAINYDYLQDLT